MTSANTGSIPGGEPDRIDPVLDGLVVALRSGPGPLTTFLEEHREALPEVWALKALSDDPMGDLHKDNFVHTVKVIDQCGETDDTTLLAALFHDVGKPTTRRVDRGQVSFHGHEVVGARLVRRRCKEWGIDPEPIVTTIFVAARAQSYDDSWTDSSVRRIRHDAGDRWDGAIRLAHSDVTSKHAHVHRRVHQAVDALTTRSDDLLIEDARRAERPVLDGNDLAELGVPRGPEMGRLLRWLLEENRAGRLEDPDDARAAITARRSE
ncbi:MAG: HD domain-containing protein [Microthrixaceae bacterium]